MGVHKNTYARWEREERELGASDLARLIAMGWNPNWVLTGDGPERMGGNESAQQRHSQAVRLDVGRLKSAVKLLEVALELSGKVMGPADKADLVADLYTWLDDHGDALTPDNLVDFNSRLSARLRQG